MIPDWQSRTALLLGEEKLKSLQKAHVLIAGLGGVGAYVAEQLARAGIGQLTIVDSDQVSASNKNRQLLALSSTQGQKKADVMAGRLLDINPELQLTLYDDYLRDERITEILEACAYDYVVDAIDTLSPKIFLIYHTRRLALPLVSSMGAGGKTDPTQIQISDFAKSHGCPLAFLLRKKLRKLGVHGGFQVIFSPEPVAKSVTLAVEERNKKTVLGTISYMPALFGCFCASVVIRDITNSKLF